MIPGVVQAGNAGPFTLDGTRTHLIGTRHVAVVDPGPDVEDHVRALVRSVSGAVRVEILVTHAHPDHSAAALPLAERLGHRARLLGAAPGCSPLRDGDAVSTDEGALLTLETPGHSQRHLSFFHRDSGALFCGDLLLGTGDTTWVGEYPDAVTDYLASLRRLEGMGVRTIHSAHGPPLADGEASIRRFLAHRLRRVDQVRDLRQRCPDATVADLVGDIYGDALPPALYRAALGSVRAILSHLGENTDGEWESEP